MYNTFTNYIEPPGLCQERGKGLEGKHICLFIVSSSRGRGMPCTSWLSGLKCSALQG
jgi:hypothetical protein